MGWEARIGGSGCTWRSCTLPPYPAQVFTLLGVHEFLPSMELLSKWQGRLCKLEPTLCVNILAAVSVCQHPGSSVSASGSGRWVCAGGGPS